MKLITSFNYFPMLICAKCTNCIAVLEDERKEGRDNLLFCVLQTYLMMDTVLPGPLKYIAQQMFRRKYFEKCCSTEFCKVICFFLFKLLSPRI